jgi:hypothetical protein
MRLQVGFTSIVANIVVSLIFVYAIAIPTFDSPLLLELTLPRQDRHLVAIPAQVPLEQVYLVLSEPSTMLVVGIAIAGLQCRRGRTRLDLPRVA